MKKILCILGTRPEAIKLAPLILELKKYPNEYEVVVCNTEQQKELSNQTLSFFNLKADINLDIMQINQSLPELQSRLLAKLSTLFQNENFDATIVQGDTMTVFCGALAAFYHKVPVFHVEAGLRSYDLLEPFPEEAIRQMASRITNLHFAPTIAAKKSLLQENIEEENILITGNTVIDALHCISDDILVKAQKNLEEKGILFNDNIVLVTAHRRENHGARLDGILNAIQKLAEKFLEHQFILPMHPNPNVKGKVVEALKNVQNIILTEALDYPELVCLMKEAKLVLTDSGGIQEEAPTFQCPVLVMRYESERKEGVEAGFAKLVGADSALIIKEAEAVLSKDKAQSRIRGKINPYGDGKASQKICESIGQYFQNKD